MKAASFLGALMPGRYPKNRFEEIRQGSDDLFACRPLSRLSKRLGRMISIPFVLLLPWALLALASPAHASQAYGSINNFDTVNDTGVVCHGFEIEIDGIHSKDITYTYDYNHYGVPKISEDDTNPLIPRVFVRYESAKKADGSWASYTAIPAAPIPPTAGHQFTNPSLNFGGEHFGVGFYGTPAAVKYNWLKDDGAGRLVFAGAVNISTPAFAYIPPINAAPPQVQAAIVPPPPPAPPVLEFGTASWVKETRTSSHNNNKVDISDLVSPDPADPNAKDWRNGEPDEVEVEWQLFQTDFNAGNGGVNGEIVGAPEDLPNGDEVITRRYDFFKYVGPVDPQTGEALADTVGPDGVHGVGIYANVVIVGDYVGAQMAGFDAAGKIGLIGHVQDGEVNVPYVERSIVIGGTAPIVTTRTGSLPKGMSFNGVTGILSGTPTEGGAFKFTVHSKDASGGDVTATYTLTIVQPFTVTTSASPGVGGTTRGGGVFNGGDSVTVLATPKAGYHFVNWTVSGVIVSSSASYTFTVSANRNLVANFALTVKAPALATLTLAPSALTGGASATGTVTLTGASPAGGAQVALSGTSPATVPTKITVAAGQKSATFTITTTRVETDTTVYIGAACNGVSTSAPLTIQAMKLSALSFRPGRVQGGANTTLIVTLTDIAPKGGAMVILLSGDTTLVPTPLSVTVPAGASQVTVTIKTTGVMGRQQVTVEGFYKSVQKSATLTLTP